MSEILKVFTPEQLTELTKNKIIADNVGLTNFNVGSRTLSILEAIGQIESSTGLDYLEALRRAVPISLYDGLNFTRNAETNSTGFIRLYRLPSFTVEYTGVDASCLLDVDATDFITTTSGTPADDLAIDFATYGTVTLVVDQINAHGSYTAVLVSTGVSASTEIYDYVSKQLVGVTNYRNATGLDIMEGAALLFNYIAGVQVGVGDVLFTTIAASQIAVGDATSPPIAAQALFAGDTGNIIALAIDTLNGNGFIQGSALGAEHTINDSAFSGGANEETDDEREIRFQAHIQGLNGSTVRGIEAAVLEVVGIKSVSVRENFPQPGQITVTADDGTGVLSVAKNTEIFDLLEGDPNDFANNPGFRAAGITVNVVAPTVVPVDITVTVTRVGTISDSTEVQTVVRSAIEQYVNTRKLGDDVVLAEIIRVGKGSHPAVYDLTISVPAVNASIDKSSIPRTGSGTGALVTVIITTVSTLP